MAKAKSKSKSSAEMLAAAAAQMTRLFPCSQRSFAHWSPDTMTPRASDGKLVPKYVTEHRAVTVADWQAHLRGERAVVLPLRCDDDTAQVALIDVDKYDVDVTALLKKVRLLGLPLYVSLSKSGGPHVTVFHDAPIPVADNERLAGELARRLELYDKFEIFPRVQSRPGVLGNDVNMPYFGSQRGYLRLEAGGALEETPLAEFLAGVDRMTAEQRAPLLASPADDAAGRGRAFAAAMLARYKAEIGNEPVGGRNILINKVAFHLATMAARDWIGEADIEDELVMAARAAGWDNERKTLDTVRRAIRAGLKQPHEDLDEHYAANIAAVMELNKDHALVLAGDKAAVLNEQSEHKFRLLTVAAFNEWLANRFATVTATDASGEAKDKRVPLAKFWRSHPQRRQYSDLVFRPGQETPGVYNLWRGFAVQPRKGDCSRILAHFQDNICRGDEGLFAWVEAWWADIAQRPASKCGTSLVLRGKPGVGKSKVAEYMQSIFGQHLVIVADPRYVTGRFNSHLASCLVLCAEEAFWAGDRSAEGKIKDLITGTSHWLELKGKEAFRVDNFVRLFVIGNPNWLVPAALRERRFAVLDVGEEHQEDHAYFKAIDEEMQNGGSQALLHHLLHEVDCSKVNLRQIPDTAALLEQKIASMTAEEAWWLDVLRQGVLPGDRDGAGVAPREAMYTHYIAHARNRGVTRRMSETALGMFLTKYAPPTQEYKPSPDDQGRRGRCRVFPSLADCREHFAKQLQAENKAAELEWGETDDWDQDGGVFPPF
jgi:Family of unknown function (DUF5906)